MIQICKKFLLFTFTLLLIFWTLAALPWSQNKIVHFAETKLSEATGLQVQIKRIDLFVPFVIRLHDISVLNQQSKSICTCERLSLSPLYIDIPFHHYSIIRLKARHVMYDLDVLEQHVESSQQASLSSSSIWIPFLSFSSAHIKSSRLPLKKKALDCSIKGSMYLPSNNSAHYSGSISRSSPNLWPKQIQFDIKKEASIYDIHSTVSLSTKGLSSLQNQLFDDDDTLSLSLKADLNQSQFYPLQSLEGSWNLSCPTGIRKFSTQAVEFSAIGNGSIRYIPNEDVSISCDSFDAHISQGTLRKKPTDLDSRLFIINYPFEPKRNLHFSLCGKITSFSKENDTNLLKIDIPKLSLNEASGHLEGTLVTQLENNQLHSEGTVQGLIQAYKREIPINIHSKTVLNKDKFTTSGDISAATIHALWNHESGEKQNSWATIRCRDLSFFQPLMNKELMGRVELSLSKTPQHPPSLSGHVSDFTLGSLHCSHASISLSKNPTAPHKSSIIAELASTNLFPLYLDRAHFSASFDNSNQTVHILDTHLIGQLNEQPLDLLFSGTTKLLEKELSLNHIDGTLGGNEISLEKEFYLSWTKTHLSKVMGAIRIGTHCHLNARWNQSSPVQGGGEFYIEHLPINLITGKLFSQKVAGYVDANCHYQSTPKTVDASLQVNAELFRPNHLGLQQGNIAIGSTATISEGNLETEICAAGTGIPDPFVLLCTCPIQKAEESVGVTISKKAPLSGSVKGTVHLSEMFAPWMPAAAYFDGIADADLELSGSINDPYLAGPFSLHSGRTDLLATGEALSNIEMEGLFEKETVHIHTITATDAHQGTVKGSGKCVFSPRKPFQWIMDLSCSNLECVALEYASFTANGSIHLTGTTDTLHISGNAQTQKAHIDLAARFPASISELSVTFLNSPSQKASPFIVSFDLSIDGSDGLEIRGRGLQSTWKGTVQLQGKTNALRMKGLLSCHEGSFTLANKRLSIDEGTISVSGNLFKDSRIQVTANTELPNLTARINVRGSLETPRFSVQSTPPRTGKEILSLLLFNKEYSEVSPLESLQLANTALSLDRSSGPFQLIDNLKQSFGIDLIDIGSSQVQPKSTSSTQLDTDAFSPIPQNDVSLRVGKYISSGVIVTVSRDISSDANRVGISAPLGHNISAEAEVGDDAVGIISLKWKKDY